MKAKTDGTNDANLGFEGKLWAAVDKLARLAVAAAATLVSFLFKSHQEDEREVVLQ